MRDYDIGGWKTGCERCQFRYCVWSGAEGILAGRKMHESVRWDAFVEEVRI